MDKINEFFLEMITPDRLFFEGNVESLTFVATTGEMGILYNASPIVTALKAGILKIKQNDKWMEASNGEGFVEVRPKKVIIMTQSAEWPYELNLNKVQTDISTMTDVLKKEQSLREYKLAKAQLARHFARLRLKNKDID